MRPSPLLLAAGLVAGCASPPAASVEATELPEPDAIVLAHVNDTPLTLQDAMDSFVASHGGGHKVLVRGEPAVRELAGRLVERELFMAEALALGIPEDPRILDALRAFGYGVAAELFWQREVTDRIDVPDEDVETFYEKTGVVLAISLIESKTREEADALKARIVAGEDFEELASAESIHSSRSFGGTLPIVRRGELEDVLDDAVFQLREPGELTPVVATEGGFAFARLDLRTENEQQPPRDVMIPRIRKILEDRREDELRAEVEERLRREAEVSLADELLTKETLLGDAADETVVARAAGEELSLGELRAALDPRAVEHIPDEEVSGFLASMADDWALERAVAQACDAMGLLDEPEIAEKTAALEAEAVLGFLYRDYVYADLDVSEQELRDYYEANKETSFTRPPELRVAYVVTETEEEATRLKERIANGESLEELAREHSIDDAIGATQGRSMWMRPGMMLEEVETVAFALDVGELGGPVETEVGYFVLEVLERKEAEPLSFETSRAAALRRMMTTRRREAYDRWALRLRDRARIEILEEGVRQATRWLDENQDIEELFGPQLEAPLPEAPAGEAPAGEAPVAPEASA